MENLTQEIKELEIIIYKLTKEKELNEKEKENIDRIIEKFYFN